MKLPEDRMYTENSLWVKQEENSVSIGVTQPAAEKAQKFLFLDLVEEGSKLEEGDLIGEYEALKRIGELRTPFSGEIEEVNSEAVENPEKIVEEPYKSPLVKIKTDESRAIDSLMNKNEAKKYYNEKV